MSKQELVELYFYPGINYKDINVALLVSRYNEPELSLCSSTAAYPGLKCLV